MSWVLALGFLVWSSATFVTGCRLYLKAGLDVACYQGCPVNWYKKIVLIDRIVVLKNRKNSPLPLCNAKCPLCARPQVILAMFT